jgi:putative DNA primase/helicase
VKRGDCTEDSHILSRRWGGIDIDPHRASGISATDEEKAAAFGVMQKIAGFLRSLGWSLRCGDSGNGYHLNIALDLPNDIESRDLLKQVLTTLSTLFGSSAVIVDCSVFNAARIWKTYGTPAAKGDHSPERPHRLAVWLDDPTPCAPITQEQLRHVAGLIPEAPKVRPHNSTSNGTSDKIAPDAELSRALRERVEHVIVHEKSIAGGNICILSTCPFGNDGPDGHERNDAGFVTFWDDGGVAARCHHNRCQYGASEGFSKFLDRFAPDLKSQKKPPSSNANFRTKPNVVHSAAESAVEPDSDLGFSEIALSQSFARTYGENFRYVETLKEWFVYDEAETRWKPDNKLLRFTIAKRFLIEAGKEFSKVFPDKGERFYTSLESASTVAAVINLARSNPIISATQERFDVDNWLMNTPGDALDCHTGKLRSGKREDYFTKITACAPKDMPTPVFDQFMRDIMGAKVPTWLCKCAACVNHKHDNGECPDGHQGLDGSVETCAKKQIEHDVEVENLVAYLLRVYGYCLTGDTKDHILVFQIGDGGNGKGVLNDVISEYILGQAPDGYACEIPMEALLVRKNEQHPTELMNLWHARLALARESEEGTQWNEGRVKRLSGGDPVTARRMRQDFVTFKSTHKTIAFGQYKPKVRGAGDPAWKRRLHLIDFPQKYDTEPDEANHVLKADLGLKDKLKDEAPGMFHKLIGGLLDHQRQGFAKPETIKATSSQYLRSQNLPLQWVAEETEAGADFSVPLSRAFPAFAAWLVRMGQRQEWDAAGLLTALERARYKISSRTNRARNVIWGFRLKSQETQKEFAEEPADE